MCTSGELLLLSFGVTHQLTSGHQRSLTLNPKTLSISHCKYQKSRVCPCGMCVWGDSSTEPVP